MLRIFIMTITMALCFSLTCFSQEHEIKELFRQSNINSTSIQVMCIDGKKFVLVSRPDGHVALEQVWQRTAHPTGKYPSKPVDCK